MTDDRTEDDIAAYAAWRRDPNRITADALSAPDVEWVTRDNWPGAVSDGLSLACSDCDKVPRFDYIVDHSFWRRWVPGKERLGVVCLPCLDRRCGGVGLAEALVEVQWTGTGHTVVLLPERRYEYARLSASGESPDD